MSSWQFTDNVCNVDFHYAPVWIISLLILDNKSQRMRSLVCASCGMVAQTMFHHFPLRNMFDMLRDA